MGWVSCQEDAEKRDRVSFQESKLYVSPGFKSSKSKYEDKIYTTTNKKNQKNINDKAKNKRTQTRSLRKSKNILKPYLKTKFRNIKHEKQYIYNLKKRNGLLNSNYVWCEF